MCRLTYMCHFIFIGMPKELDPTIGDALAQSHKQRLAPSWMSIAGHDLTGEVFYTTAKYCDCGTTIGSRNRGPQSVESRIPRKLKVWRRKKWSEAKIARAIAAMSDEYLHQRSDETDPIDWLAFLNALRSATHSGHVSLVLHWCGSESNFSVKGTNYVGLSQLQHDDLLDWHEDVLYVCSA